jgi:hypothetical protein
MVLMVFIAWRPSLVSGHANSETCRHPSRINIFRRTLATVPDFNQLVAHCGCPPIRKLFVLLAEKLVKRLDGS